MTTCFDFSTLVAVLWDSCYLGSTLGRPPQQLAALQGLASSRAHPVLLEASGLLVSLEVAVMAWELKANVIP